MQTWIALLRGINVGGRNKLPMAQLREMFESVGCQAVRTYIQSGNVIFRSSIKSKPNLERKLVDAIDVQFGFRPNILLLTDRDFRSAVSNNPFPEAIAEPKTLHFFFLYAKWKAPDLGGLAKLAVPSERFQLVDNVFYLSAPDGFGRSRLASSVDRILDVETTARNYSTIESLMSMLDAD